MNTREEFFLCKQFREDPFATTNALQEKYLEECFIQPSYYMSLLGSVKNPRTSFVTAPRGTGKTAQRVMLERFAGKENGTLAVVYDDFPIEECSDIKELTLEKHLVRIMRTLILSLLSEIHRKKHIIMLDGYEKRQLKSLIELYLSGINSREVASAIEKIKGLGGKLEDLWCKAGNSITAIINMILAKNEMGNIKLDNIRKNTTVNIEDIKSHYDFIEKLFNSIGITAVYILVDSIDETAMTGNNAEKSYYLIRPFVLDLRFLERKTIVFKFFVWDKIKSYWAQDFREDRIEHFEIEWSQKQIEQLLNERIKGYSDGKYKSVKDILTCDEMTISYIYIFANNSPRDAINILKAIFDEHLKDGNNTDKWPDKQTVIQGIEQFCKSKFDELIIGEKQRKDLRRIKLATFTIPYLYNEVFKCESSTARNILMPWTQSGIVIASNNKVKVKKSPNPINVYSFADIRVARVVCSNQKLEDFLDGNLCVCSECGTINVFNKLNGYGIKNWQCKNCSSELIEMGGTCQKDVATKTKVNKQEMQGQIDIWDFM